MKTIRQAGFIADLVLVNYFDEKSSVKTRIVQDANEELITFVTGKEIDMTFQEWSFYYKKLNDEKKGSTWDVLKKLEEKSFLSLR